MWETFILTLGKEGGKNTIYCCSCSLPPSHTYTSFSNIGEAVLAIWGGSKSFLINCTGGNIALQVRKKREINSGIIWSSGTLWEEEAIIDFPSCIFHITSAILSMNYSQYKSFKYSMPKFFLGSIIYLKICLLINILEPYFPQFPSKYKKFNFQFSTFSIFRSFQCGRRIDEKKVVPSSVPRVANTIAQRSVPAFPDILDNNWDDLQWLLKVKKRKKKMMEIVNKSSNYFALRNSPRTCTSFCQKFCARRE